MAGHADTLVIPLRTKSQCGIHNGGKLLCLNRVLELKQNHKNRMVLSGRDLRDHLVPTPCLGKGHLALDHAPLNPTQHLNTSRDVAFHSFSGQLISVPNHLPSKEFLPITTLRDFHENTLKIGTLDMI